MKALEHLSCEDSLREQGLLSPEMRLRDHVNVPKYLMGGNEAQTHMKFHLGTREPFVTMRTVPH